MRETELTTGLLVSVRGVREAEAALAGGAALIDVKDPGRGPLGRADDAVIRAVVAAVAGRRPVSAALGEWRDGVGDIPDAALTYVKWGLAGCREHSDWRTAWRSMQAWKPQVVLAAYADWQCARAPSLDEVFALAAEHPGSVMLIDTCCKVAPRPGGKRPTLLDWLPVCEIVQLCRQARAAKVRIALAGSLGLAEIVQLKDARPDWFAVRGAACADADRDGEVQVDKVKQLVDAITPRPSRAG